MKIILRLLLAIVVAVVLLFGVLLVRTYTYPSLQVETGPWEPVTFDADAAADHLAGAIRIKTISHQIPWEQRLSAFTEFHAYLAETFPKAHAAMTREVVNDYSLLYTWEGSDPEAQPILLLAHMDVVPVDGASAQEWTHPPFDGVVADGHIWGRGAIDDKCSVIGILEAVEALSAEGFQPKRSIYLAFGHDEEIGGKMGAGKMAALLEARGVKAWFCLDEGSAAVDGIIPGIDWPIALIAIAEKGYVTLELVAMGEGGHSSQPPAQTSLGVLAAAIAKLEAQQMPGGLRGPFRQLFEYAAPEMTFPMNVVMSNLWITAPLVKRIMLGDPTTAAALRTTTAATIMEAGTKENVLPIKSRAVVNFRILPGDTSEDVVAHVKAVVNDDRVRIKILGTDTSEPSPVSDPESESYRLLARSVRQVFDGAPVAPGMTLGATDSKHYHAVADNVYRFQPQVLSSADLAGIHGTDERIEIENFLRGIRTYAQIIKAAAG